MFVEMFAVLSISILINYIWNWSNIKVWDSNIPDTPTYINNSEKLIFSKKAQTMHKTQNLKIFPCNLSLCILAETAVTLTIVVINCVCTKWYLISPCLSLQPLINYGVYIKQSHLLTFCLQGVREFGGNI